MNRSCFSICVAILAVGVALAGVARGQSGPLSADVASRIDKIASDALAGSGVPSASIAIVKDGQIAYVKAYGTARLEPKTPATPAMRYSIGSISKQFTAAAILLLQEQGKLSLDDKVGEIRARSHARERGDDSPVACRTRPVIRTIGRRITSCR